MIRAPMDREHLTAFLRSLADGIEHDPTWYGFVEFQPVDLTGEEFSVMAAVRNSNGDAWLVGQPEPESQNGVSP